MVQIVPMQKPIPTQPQQNSSNKVLGNKGEKIAKTYLLKKGYSFVAQNFRQPIGEIDLIFTKRISIIFVEVKSRSSSKFGNPEEAISKGKLSHIRKSAELFLIKNPQFQSFSPQIDVVAIDTATSEIRHWEAVY